MKEENTNYKNYHVTLATYFRFKLPELLPNVDKLLYLDCDVIIQKPLNELFKYNLENIAAMMVKDAECQDEAERLEIKNYYNAGVMLINLDFWRKNKIFEKFFSFIKSDRNRILWQDQDILNCVLEGFIQELDSRWNYQYFLYDNPNIKEVSNCVILHYAGRYKPWLITFEHPIYDIYYHYLGYTQYRNRITEYRLNSNNKFLKNNIGGKHTNVLVGAFDEDMQKIYEEISKLYEHFEWLLNNKIDTSVSFLTEHLKWLINNKIDTSVSFITQHIDFFDEDRKKIYKEVSKLYEHLEWLINNKIDASVAFLIEHIDKRIDEIER